MKARSLHGWDLTPKEAIALQSALHGRVVREDRIGAVRRVAGVDIGFEQDGRVTRAAVAILEFPACCRFVRCRRSSRRSRESISRPT
mgnify:CR=1 FL=1